ncbi:MAG: alanine racemase [Oscillospiraceae bacterium]|nr:alanine racemase [Oscillospiraceae bacterium]MDD3832517.1 alanine racemase [Oscillospiraceae bacterium]
MIEFLKRTWAQINLDAIENNFRAITKSLSAGCQAMAIVKADAYGHGAGYVSRTLRDAGATWFGVSNLDEALQIRNEGIDQSILILAYTPPAQASKLAANRITQTVFTSEYAQQLSRSAVNSGVKVRIHIKLDTGMSRIGFFCQSHEEINKSVDEIASVCSLPGLEAEGIFTHFTSADEESGEQYTRLQFERFQRVTHILDDRGVKFALKHCCNSAASMRFPEMHLDLVRPGLILYGLSPDVWMQDKLLLTPAMELKTVVSMTKTVPAGTTISYGRTYTTQGDLKLATLPIGYADGFPRGMSNRAEMLVCGRRASVVGRVCMDQCMLDVTGIDEVKEGITVTVFGHDGDEFLPVEKFADLSGTINYEIICSIGKRVPRIFQSRGQIIGQLNYIEAHKGEYI